MRIKANGITFNCEIEGPADAPWLVFSNSLATNLSMWDPQAADLGRSFRLLRYDQRGHGGTDAPAGRYTYATLVADALAVFDALGIERPHFCGLSMGGFVAMRMAALPVVTAPKEADFELEEHAADAAGAYGIVTRALVKQYREKRSLGSSEQTDDLTATDMNVLLAQWKKLNQISGTIATNPEGTQGVPGASGTAPPSITM